MVHIYAGGPATDVDGHAPLGAGAIDHPSLAAIGDHGFIARLRAQALEWRALVDPGTIIWRLFVHEPNGVMLQLGFEGRAGEGPDPNLSEIRRYRAGENFFHQRAPSA